MHMPMATLINPANLSVANPPFATEDPANPPIIACDELDGNPKNQVIKFHAMAPMSAEKRRVVLTALASMRSFPMVLATIKLKNMNAMKLKKEAHSTAWRGVSTPVVTMVAIVFAAS